MKDQKVSEIQDLALFGGCRGDDVRWIAGVADSIDVPAGKTIVQDGQSVREFVVVVKGAATASGSNGTVVLSAGSYFGESGLVDGGSHTRTIETTTPARLLVFGAGAFRGMLERIPSVGRKLLARKVTALRASDQASRSLRAVS